MKFFVDGEGLLYKVKFRKSDTHIIIPEGVTSIGSDVFFSSKNRTKRRVKTITNVRFPSTIEFIGDNTFRGLENLREIEIPSSIKQIGKSAFEGCANLEKVRFSEGLENISDFAFDRCIKLRSVDFPDSLTHIGAYAFSGCDSLKEVKIPNSVTFIDSGSFYKCKNLEKIGLPDSLTVISPRLLSDCVKLKEVEVLNGVFSINEFSFSGCRNLEKVVLPDSLKSIKRQAFSFCDKLQRLDLPKHLENIDSAAFFNCSNLETVHFSSEVRGIDRATFDQCGSLKYINLPKGLRAIGGDAFANCTSLEEIVIPSTIRYVDDEAFDCCYNLKKIILQNIFALNEKVIRKMWNYQCFYNSNTKEVLVLKEGEEPDQGFEKIDRYITCTDREYGNMYVSMILSLIFEKEQYKNIESLQNDLAKVIGLKELNNENHIDFLRDFKFDTEYVRLRKRILSKLPSHTMKYEINTMFYDLFELAYSLGAFCEDQVKRQRACEFIYNMFDKEKFSCRTFHSVFGSIRLTPFNQEWANFFMNKSNYEKLIQIDVENNDFISKIHNHFNDIREFGRSNRGSQRYRKVTIEMCEEYFMKNNFEGVNEINEDISREIVKYIHSQECFDEATSIRKKYLELKDSDQISDHILKEELKSILNDISETMSNLNEVANDLFSYEFLSKYDPKNFVLGKYCSCCAHLEGAGNGIMKASILHPDCQNLVIKDETGRIIAKSTLYVNRKQGYGVFNNVEINNKYINNDEVLDKIYEKYISAVNDFANRYNQLYPDNPIKKINVGMKLNDLDRKLRMKAKRSSVILQGIDFSNYGNYGGDWKEEQYVVWSKKDKVAKNK